MVRAAPLPVTPAEQRDVSHEASEPRHRLVWNLFQLSSSCHFSCFKLLRLKTTDSTTAMGGFQETPG